MKRPATALFSLAALAAQPAFLPPERIQRLQEGIREVYNLEYDRAAGIFQSLINEAPDDPAGHAYLAYTYWLQEFAVKQGATIDRYAASDFFVETPKSQLRVDPAVEARFLSASQQAIALAKARLAKNPKDRAAIFFLGFAYQNRASYDVAFRRGWWSAFRNGNQTRRYHTELQRLEPNFADTKLALGVVHYVAGSLKGGKRFLAFLAGYRGDKEHGKRELETAAQQGVLVSQDAAVVLGLILALEKNYGKAFEYFAGLHRKYPQNYLLELDMAGLALRDKQIDRSLAIYREILRKREAGEPKYRDVERATIYTRLGVAFREQGDYAQSVSYFRGALADRQTTPRMKTLARLEMGKTLDLMGRRQEAVDQYKEAAAAEDVAGSRDEASSLLRTAYRK